MILSEIFNLWNDTNNTISSLPLTEQLFKQTRWWKAEEIMLTVAEFKVPFSLKKIPIKWKLEAFYFQMSKQRIRGKWNHYTGLFTSFQAEFWSITDIHQNISLLKKKINFNTATSHTQVKKQTASLGLSSSIRKITAFNSFKTTTASKQTKAWGHLNLLLFHTALYCLCPLETAHNNNLSKITAFQQKKHLCQSSVSNCPSK